MWLCTQRIFHYWHLHVHNLEDKSCFIFSYISIKPAVCLKITLGGFDLNDSLS